jgi:apolipoprotein N-acyltransferase
VVTLPAQARPTFYARAGDLFGWSCLALAMLLVGLVRRRMSAGPRSEPGP